MYTLFCKNCGKCFISKKETQKFCCRKCADLAKTTKTLVKCKVCGKEFYATPSEIKRGAKYCSSQCMGLDYTTKKLVKCKNCGKEFMQIPSRIKNNGLFCCRNCYDEYQKKHNDIIIKDDYAIILINSIKYNTQKALIDIEDVDKCKNITWCLKPTYNKDNEFYVEGRSENKNIKLHRLIMNAPQDKEVDHINHNPLDNRKSNLRICNHFENMKNISNNKSGICGVCWAKNVNKWRAFLNGKHIGYFTDKQAAIDARLKAELLICH